MSWPEIEQAEQGNRREIVLSGSTVSDRDDGTGMSDSGLFSLVQLNFLEISKSSLSHLSDDLGKLENLTSLVICGNELETVPNSIEYLKKLKLLDISSNKLHTLSDSVGMLENLETLNVAGNNLDDFPDVSALKNLHILDASNNKLDALPDGISDPNLALLQTIKASKNNITEMPSDLSNLTSLKTLDMSNNKLDTVPPQLSECLKLKELTLGGNKLKDRRLGKMITSCSTKAILDYLAAILEKEKMEGGGKGKGKKKRNRKKSKSQSDEVEDLGKNLMSVLKFQQDAGVTVQVKTEVLEIRPYIVCCIVHHLDLRQSSNMFKRFITLQTKLHDSICQKRQAATIATHDLKKVKLPLTYDARDHQTLMIVPLHSQKPVSALRLFAKLRQEAEEVRKEKKRNTLSGIHKYLDLLKGKKAYPCIADVENTIISLPPITNSETTKVSRETTDILIEVTSSSSLDTCKKVMDAVLEGILELGAGRETAEEVVGGDAAAAEADNEDDVVGAEGGDTGHAFTRNQKLVVEQVKVLDSDGGLKVLYPSRTDILSEKYFVKRP